MGVGRTDTMEGTSEEYSDSEEYDGESSSYSDSDVDGVDEKEEEILREVRGAFFGTLVHDGDAPPTPPTSERRPGTMLTPVLDPVCAASPLRWNTSFDVLLKTKESVGTLRHASAVPADRQARRRPARGGVGDAPRPSAKAKKGKHMPKEISSKRTYDPFRESAEETKRCGSPTILAHRLPAQRFLTPSRFKRSPTKAKA